jgi:hypothetical protein
MVVGRILDLHSRLLARLITHRYLHPFTTVEVITRTKAHQVPWQSLTRQVISQKLVDVMDLFHFDRRRRQHSCLKLLRESARNWARNNLRLEARDWARNNWRLEARDWARNNWRLEVKGVGLGGCSCDSETGRYG